jgi:hypothetical protein
MSVLSFESFREQWQRQVMADCDLRPSHKLVCMALSLHFNRNEGGAAWPSFETLADLTGQARRTIIRATRKSNGAAIFGLIAPAKTKARTYQIATSHF